VACWKIGHISARDPDAIGIDQQNYPQRSSDVRIRRIRWPINDKTVKTGLT
jgi:hypothetical protein